MTRRRPEVFDLDAVEADGREPADEAPFPSPEPAPTPTARRRTRRRAEPQEIARQPDDTVTLPADVGTAPAAPKRRWSWLGLFAWGVSGLAGLALSISVYAFIEDLFSRTPVLGGLAAVLAAMAVLGLIGMVLREWVALRRLREVESLRTRADEAVAQDDRKKAIAVLKDLSALYADRPGTARGRTAMKAHLREIIDGRDLIGLGERELLSSLDREAVSAVVGSARRVAAVTALSPRALVDVLFVLFTALALVRRLAVIYGGRPGVFGFMRVLRHAVAHLAVTGGMAAGDSLMGEVIGKGIAARLSAKLGEGIVNGLMTARLGIATIDVLRPLPYVATRQPRINDVLSEIARLTPAEKPADEGR